MKYLLALTTILFLSACGKNVPPAAYIKAVDCQYHVLEKAFGENTDLIDQVLEVGQGPFQIEEFIDIAATLGKRDAEIIAYGRALNECLPPELRASISIEQRVAQAKSNTVL